MMLTKWIPLNHPIARRGMKKSLGKSANYNPDTVAFVTISDWNGDNMLESSANMT